MNNLDDLSDDELYASFEAYKALLDAGLTKDQALSRTGLTAQIVKDLEDEEKTLEEEEEYDSDFGDSWGEDEDDDGFDDDSKWKEEDLEDDWGGGGGDLDDDIGYDDRY